MATMQDLEHILRRRIGHSPEAQILDDQQGDPGHLGNVESPTSGGRGLGHVLEQIEGRLVLHPVTGLDRFHAHGNDQVGLPDSRLGKRGQALSLQENHFQK